MQVLCVCTRHERQQHNACAQRERKTIDEKTFRKEDFVVHRPFDDVRVFTLYPLRALRIRRGVAAFQK